MSDLWMCLLCVWCFVCKAQCLYVLLFARLFKAFTGLLFSNSHIFMLYILSFVIGYCSRKIWPCFFVLFTYLRGIWAVRVCVCVCDCVCVTFGMISLKATSFHASVGCVTMVMTALSNSSYLSYRNTSSAHRWAASAARST